MQVATAQPRRDSQLQQACVCAFTSPAPAHAPRQVSDTAVHVRGKGLRANEVLELDLAVPLFPVADVGASAAAAAAAAASEEPAAAAEAEAGSSNESSGAAAVEQAEAAAAADPASAPASPAGGGHLLLRCGQLLVAGDVDAAGSQLDFRVQSLKLDELELASLRGDLAEASCSLHFGSQTGRGKLALQAPRFSGLRGESLSGGFRWERDVVRLERVVLAQARSRYEVQGEYNVPPNMRIPASAADLLANAGARRQQRLPGQAGGSGGSGSLATAAGGRWRVAVSVPAADMQEVMPAARLLQNATSMVPSDYERAKAAFLEAVQRAGLRTGELKAQVAALTERLKAEEAAAVQRGAGAGATAAESPLQLPSLQELRGQWSGSIQVGKLGGHKPA